MCGPDGQRNHTAACQAGDLSFSASHLGANGHQHTFHIRACMGVIVRTRFKHSMPGDVAGACLMRDCLFVQTGRLQFASAKPNPLINRKYPVTNFNSRRLCKFRLGSRTESRAPIGVATKTHLIIIRPWRSCVHQHAHNSL